MKNKSQWFLAIGASIVLIVSCAKEGLENTYPGSTTTNGALNNFFVQHAPPVQQFTFNAAQGGFFTGALGATITVQGGAFLYQNNTPVTGNVTLSLQEVYNKRDIILSGAYTTSNGNPLVSGGEVNITAYQGNQELKLASSSAVTVTIPAGNTQPPTMKEFRAPAFGPTRDYIPVNPTQNVTTSTDTSGSWVYTFAIDSLDWTNCDQYMVLQGNLVEFNVAVPLIFNDTNCMVFVTSTFSNYASKIWDYDSVLHLYKCNYYRLPEGEQFTFSAIAEINGNFYWDTQEVTITDGVVISLHPQATSEAQIMQNLGNL